MTVMRKRLRLENNDFSHQRFVRGACLLASAIRPTRVEEKYLSCANERIDSRK